MSNNGLAVRRQNTVALPSLNEQHADIVSLITRGDLNGLNPEQILQVYIARCDALGVDARTQPFDILTFQGKKTLYPNARLAEQLISQYGLSVEKTREETTREGLRVVEVRVSDGRRSVMASAAISVSNLGLDAVANAWMKCETKATRRGVLRFCGLGAMADAPDEDDLVQTRVDMATGEVVDVAAEDARKTGLKRLHAAGKERGLNHDQVRGFAQQHHPKIASLTELDGGQLDVLADAIKEVSAADLVDPYKMALAEAPEWANDIRDVTTIEELHQVRDLIQQAGVTGKDFPELLRWYTAKQNRLKLAEVKQSA